MKKLPKSLHLQPDQPLSPIHIAAMMVAICRSPEARAAARDGIDLDDFNSDPEADAIEEQARLLLDIVLAVTGRGEFDGAVPKGDIDVELFGPTYNGNPVTTALNEEDGLLALAYNSPAEGGLDTLSGELSLRLVRQFCRERGGEGRLRKKLASFDDKLIGAGFTAILQGTQAYLEKVDGLGAGAALSAASLTLGATWDAHEKILDRDRGKAFLGLRTGIVELDRRTLGLRGLTLLGGQPGTGKTALACDVAVGVCEAHEDNDAIVILVTLEMAANLIQTRIKTNLAQLDWDRYTRGSPEPADWVPGQKFNQEDLAKVKAAKQRCAEGGGGARLFIIDRAALGKSWDAATIVRLAKEAKAAAVASRVLIIFDHLQYITLRDDGIERSDIACDKARMQIVHEVRDGLRTVDDADPAVLLIAQTRKPASSKDAWGTALSEFLGAAEIAFACDAAILLHRMAPDEVGGFYASLAGDWKNKSVKAQIEAFLKDRREKGITPIVSDLAKARDGRIFGDFGLEFMYRQSRYTVIGKTSPAPAQVDDENDECEVVVAEIDDTEAKANVKAKANAKDKTTFESRAAKMRAALTEKPGSTLTVLRTAVGQSSKVASKVLQALIEAGEVEPFDEDVQTRFKLVVAAPKVAG
jgi:hypothetical protein